MLPAVGFMHGISMRQNLREVRVEPPLMGEGYFWELHSQGLLQLTHACMPSNSGAGQGSWHLWTADGSWQQWVGVHMMQEYSNKVTCLLDACLLVGNTQAWINAHTYQHTALQVLCSFAGSAIDDNTFNTHHSM
jgi:hypothetical protein